MKIKQGVCVMPRLPDRTLLSMSEDGPARSMDEFISELGKLEESDAARLLKEADKHLEFCKKLWKSMNTQERRALTDALDEAHCNMLSTTKPS